MQNEECGCWCRTSSKVGTGCHEIVSQDSRAARTSDPQASITLSLWVSFKGLCKRATKRLNDRRQRIVGTKNPQ